MHTNANNPIFDFVQKMIDLWRLPKHDRLSDRRAYLEGSESIGDLNFRTGRMDCGTDAGGWYEDDI